MGTNWTDEQRAVIDSRGCNLLVSAAAGSGKTAVLIERIISILLDEENPVDIDKLLVVTFTNAAANEMKERVRAALEDKIEEEPENQHIQRQLTLLNRAEITTIHSFCLNVLRNNFHAVQLDSNIRIADEDEISMIRADVMDQLFEEYYEAENEDFLRLVSWYSGKLNDDSLENIILMVSRFTEASPFPDFWLDNAAEKFNIENVRTDSDSESAREASQAKILYPYMRALSNVTKEFNRRMKERKKYLGVLEFSDIEHYALDILVEKEDAGKGIYRPSRIALSYRDRYEYVFTDEYQDSNMVQEVLLSMVSRDENPNRFMVGDVKQSIYRFRQAMPEIFMEKYENYEHYDTGESDNRKILLYKNFRSRKEVLEGCNYIFSNIMRKETGELDYTEEERLNPSAYFRDVNPVKDGDVTAGGPVEYYIVDDSVNRDSISYGEIEKDEVARESFADYSGFKAESQLIADIIKNLVDPESTYRIYDSKKDEYRKVQYRDIVILMRSPSTNAAVMKEIMEENRIPFYNGGSGDGNPDLEVDTVINLLRVIDNPIQDIPLLSVMRSPIYGFDAEELAKIRVEKRELDFYDAIMELYSEDPGEFRVVNEDIKKKTVHFVDSIRKFREKSKLMTIDQFIWYLYRETGYYDYAGFLEMGEIRQRNLVMLFEKAREFEKKSYKGLFNFVKYIDKCGGNIIDSSLSAIMDEEADVVKLLTIHRSKGLEFPIVILANTNKRFKTDSGDYKLSIHMDMGYGPQIIDNERFVKYDSAIKERIDKKAKAETLAEEMRLLYVAMTRAKEKLIMTGRVKGIDKAKEKWEKSYSSELGYMDDTNVINAKCYMDWILPAVYSLEKNGTAETLGKKTAPLRKSMLSSWTLEYRNITDIFNERYIAQKNEDNVEKEKQIKPPSTDIIEERLHDIDEQTDSRRMESMLQERFDKPYRYAASATKPSMITVSEIKKMAAEEEDEDISHKFVYEDTESVNIVDITKISEEMKRPEFIVEGEDDVKFTPAERGTIFHLVMQLIDFERIGAILKAEGDRDRLIKKELKNEIDDFVKRKILSEKEAETVNTGWILRFVKSRIFKDVLKSMEKGRLYREKAINYSLSINEIYKDEGIEDSEKMMMAGIVDLLFEDENGDIVILDYKTDSVTNSNYRIVSEKYRIQLDYYKKAVEEISGKKVSKRYIYLMKTGKLYCYDN